MHFCITSYRNVFDKIFTLIDNDHIISKIPNKTKKIASKSCLRGSRENRLQLLHESWLFSYCGTNVLRPDKRFFI